LLANPSVTATRDSHNIYRIIYSFFVVPPKVPKASSIVTVACSCCCRYCLKNIANVNTAEATFTVAKFPSKT
jgi:hypothetical protein